MKRTLIQKIDWTVGVTLHGVMLATLAALLVLVALVVVTRVFSLPSAGWTDELIEFLFAWLIFAGAASLWRERGHFAVTLIADTVKSERIKAATALLSELLCIVFIAVFTYQSWILIATAGNEASPVFSLPRTYWYICMPIAGVIMLAYSFTWLFQRLTGRSVAATPATDLPKYEV